MICWKPASPVSTSPPARPSRWTGPTWKPSPGPRRRAPATAPTPSILGAPQERPAALRRRAVLRLLLLRRHHDARRARPAGPGVRAADHPLIMRHRPCPRARPRPDRATRRRDRARRHPRRLRLRPPHPRELGGPAAPAGAQLIQDLHPHDRGPNGTHHGAIISNGNLYCPATPRALLELGPLARDATRGRPRHTTPGPPSWPATNSAASPATTPTATTASCAPPPWARPAARSARPP